MKQYMTKFAEAMQRQAQSNKLSTAEKLAACDPNGAKKERAKLTKRLARENAPKPAPQTKTEKGKK